MAEDAIFDIPEQNVWKLFQRLEALNKRAKRLKCPPIQYSKLGKRLQSDAESGEVTTFIQVRVDGQSPRINGWSFVAVIDHSSEGGNVLHVLPETEAFDPTPYLEGNQRCQHCKTVRARKDTYLLRHEGGKLKQVGKTCLKDFTGHPDPLSLARYAELLALAHEEANDACDIIDGGPATRKMSESYDLEAYLAYAHLAMRMHGWISRSTAQAEYRHSTADLAIRWLQENSKGAQLQTMLPNSEDEQAVQEALAWVRDLTLEGGLDSFLADLQTICKGSRISMRHVGYGAAIFVAYDRARREAREQEIAVRSQHQGTVGVRQTWEVTVENIHYYVKADGRAAAIYTFLDASDNCFKWFSSASSTLAVGERYQLTGTITQHSDYRGVKQTVLARCKAVSVEQPATIAG